jgi:hypothetical protein
MGFLRRKKKHDPAEESVARAVPARATVISAARASTTAQDVNSSSEPYSIDLEVQPPGAPGYRETVEWTVFDVAVADVQPGVELDVSIDPEIPAIVYPPGYPPPTMKPGVISLSDARILPTAKWLDARLA